MQQLPVAICPVEDMAYQLLPSCMLLEVGLQVLCTGHQPSPVVEPAMDMTHALSADSMSCTAHFLPRNSCQHLSLYARQASNTSQHSICTCRLLYTDTSADTLLTVKAAHALLFCLRLQQSQNYLPCLSSPESQAREGGRQLLQEHSSGGQASVSRSPHLLLPQSLGSIFGICIAPSRLHPKTKPFLMASAATTVMNEPN